MAIGYIQGSGEDFVGAATTPVQDDGDVSWWSGVQRSFATVAIATALATTALATQIATTVARDTEEIPAGNLFLSSIHEAGFPQFRQYTQQQRSPVIRYSGQGDEIVPQATFTEEEEYWQNPVPPVPSRLNVALPYLPDPEEIPAGSLRGQPDEDYWLNWVKPVAAANRPLEQSAFDQQEPAGSLFGQDDEDFWLNWVRPTTRALAWPQPWTFDVQESAGSLFGQDDEDFWQNPVPPVPASFRLQQQWPFDQQEPAGSLFGVPEEEPWRNPVAPVPPTLYQRLPYLHDTGDIAYAPLTIAEEDYWQNPVAPVPPRMYLAPVFIDGDEVPSKIVDEDYWTNPVAPVVASLYQALPYSAEGDDVVQEVFLTGDEEEAWLNPVWPVPPRMYQPLPIGDRDDTWQFLFIPPVPPTADLTANPPSISTGQTSMLIWTTTDATSVEIVGIGTFPANGSLPVNPPTVTIYHLIATGPGGTADSFATVVITLPPVTPIPGGGTIPAPIFRPIQPVEEHE